MWWMLKYRFRRWAGDATWLELWLLVVAGGLLAAAVTAWYIDTYMLRGM